MLRIAFIISGLYNAAGMERVLTIRTNLLCQSHDITIITHDQGDRPDVFPLDKRIHRINIAVEHGKLRPVLEPLLKKERYDITVSTGGPELFFLHKIKDGSKKIFEFHFSFDIAKVWVGKEIKGFRRWRYIQQNKWHRIYHARKYDQVVVLCETDYKKWRRYCRNVSYIYNPLTIETGRLSECTNKKAIAVGRLNNQKGFDMLVDVWSLVHRRHPEWHLDICGEGEEKDDLQKMIDMAGLSEVVTLCGKVDNIVDRYADSSIYVLSSRTEAFGLVITEAEVCGLPVVAFDCPSAPHELVADGDNGYLVPLGDIDAMAERICRLIENDTLRVEMGKRSTMMSQRFTPEVINAQWIELYERLI